GSASIRTESLYGSAGTVRLHGSLETIEASGPQLCEERLERLEPLGTSRVEAALPLPRHGDETCLLPDLQVLRHGLLGDVEVPGDLVHRPGSVADEAKHGLATGFGKSPKQGGGTHTRSLSPATVLLNP